MERLLPERPRWLEIALQGLAYWIGHRQSLFGSYPLTEGAMVAEACNLIFANLPKDLVILPERLYKNMVSPATSTCFDETLLRADLVICDNHVNQTDSSSNIFGSIKYVIEIKRGSASNQLINSDLKRLYDFKEAYGFDIRCLMFIISEGNSPRRFVKDGKSILAWNEIPDCLGYYRVRRTMKASPSFSNRVNAHYVCMLEVFLEKKSLKTPLTRTIFDSNKPANKIRS